MLILQKFFYCYRPHHISSSKGIYHFVARKTSLRLVSDMPNPNRNWKNWMNRYFFVQGTDRVCKREEWDTLPYGFDNTWGIVKDLGLVPSTLLSFIHLFAKYLTLSVSFFFSTSICPQITDEQEAFIRRVLEISFGERKWKDLVTLDTSHTYCDGPIPTLQPVVCFLLILTSTFLTSILYPLQKWKQGGKGFSKGVSCNTQATAEGGGLNVGLQGCRQRNIHVEE